MKSYFSIVFSHTFYSAYTRDNFFCIYIKKNIIKNLYNAEHVLIFIR